MKHKLNYSFDDEPVSKFCYDLDNKKIEVQFKGSSIQRLRKRSSRKALIRCKI